MSISHPKPKQIRLPFDVPRPGLSQAPKRVCGICRKRDSQYTCPRCNVAYCSLDCFKSQSHVQCSEPFYKSTVLEEIAADPKADLEEKKRMMEMLKRFEESQAEGEDILAELDNDEEEDELERAVRGIDIDDIDSNQLFHLLPQQHRDAFLHAIRHPESEEAKELLELAAKDEVADDDLPDALPWWEGDDLDTDVAIPTATAPELITESVTASIAPPAGVGIKLCFNSIAVAIAYLHVLLACRLPSLDQAYLAEHGGMIEELRGLFSSLLQFLVDPKSTVRYESTRQAWTAVWEAIGKDADVPPPPSMLVRILGILPSLLQPPILADESPKILKVLADMYQFHAVPKPGAAVPRKLAFYTVALRQLNREDWLRLRKEVEKEITLLEQETEEADPVVHEDRPALML